MKEQVEEKAWAVPPLDDLEVAFSVGTQDWLPSRDEIPDEFRFMRGTSKWCEVVHCWFFRGLADGVKWKPRPGIDQAAALRAIQAILGDWGLKHEHKEEAAAFLLDQWFEDVKKWEPTHA